ncbi:hypothetical protein [Chloroflexus sp.]|uniref:hypothetical protein n=1 Tax=Chloroflexus sp. TaxID=1904827 RepID=UPI002ADDE3B9|nr:hypothetical protein [Chloroflexus sp.]
MSGSQFGRRQILSIIAGGYGGLLCAFGALLIFFGLVNYSAVGLGGLAAFLAIIFSLPIILFAVVLIIAAIGLWNNRPWTRILPMVLAAIHLAIAVSMISLGDLWPISLLGIALSVGIFWFVRGLQD